MATTCDAHSECEYDADIETPAGNHVCDVCAQGDAAVTCCLCSAVELAESTGDVGHLDGRDWYCPQCWAERQIQDRAEAAEQALVDYGAALAAVRKVAAEPCFDVEPGVDRTPQTCLQRAQWWYRTTGVQPDLKRLCPVCRAVVMIGGAA